jgi:putative membrane protein
MIGLTAWRRADHPRPCTGLVLRVIHLFTAGSTLSRPTLPASRARLHQVAPMRHAVDGIRQLMHGGDPDTARVDAGVLLLRLAGALTLATIGVGMTLICTPRELQPSRIG